MTTKILDSTDISISPVFEPTRLEILDKGLAALRQFRAPNLVTGGIIMSTPPPLAKGFEKFGDAVGELPAWLWGLIGAGIGLGAGTALMAVPSIGGPALRRLQGAGRGIQTGARRIFGRKHSYSSFGKVAKGFKEARMATKEARGISAEIRKEIAGVRGYRRYGRRSRHYSRR